MLVEGPLLGHSEIILLNFEIVERERNAFERGERDTDFLLLCEEHLKVQGKIHAGKVC